MEQDPVQYWLDTCKHVRTKRLYEQRFKSFERWLGLSGKEMLELRKQQLKSEDITEKQWFEQKAVDFYEELCNKMASHTAWSYLTAIRSFFATFGKDMQLKIKPFMKRAGTATPLAQSQKHPFTQDELRKMYHVANLKEKTILLLGVQTGLSAGELVSLEIEDFNGWLDKEPPVGPIEIKRKKEDTTIYLMTGKDLAETLKLYIQSLQNENPPQTSGWLFCSHVSSKRIEKHIVNSEPDRIIKMLARRANIKPLGNTVIRFHGLRAYFDDSCKTMGIAEDHINMMVGHEVKYGQAYTFPTNLRVLYKKVEPRLTLSTAMNNQNHTRLVQLENQFETMKQKFEALEHYVTVVVPRYAPNLKYRDEVIEFILDNHFKHDYSKIEEIEEVDFKPFFDGQNTVIEINGFWDKKTKKYVELEGCQIKYTGPAPI